MQKNKEYHHVVVYELLLEKKEGHFVLVSDIYTVSQLLN